MNINDIRIAVAMPTYSDINFDVANSLTRACLVAQKKGFQIHSVGGTDKQLLCHARNMIIRDFLRSDATHLLCVDSDVVIPHNSIVDLAGVDQDMVTGIYFQKIHPYFPLIFAKSPRGQKRGNGKKGLHSFIIQWDDDICFPIDACGFGLCLIKRHVFEMIKEPWFEFTEKSGEDIGFCMRVRKAGLSIFCHPKVLCGHIKTYTVNIDDFKSSKLASTSQIRINAGVQAEVVENVKDIRGRYQENS